MFIKLTRINIANGAEQGDVYLNPDQIESIGLAKRGVAGERKAHTVVLMSGCAEYYVAETPEEVIELLMIAGYMSPIGKEILQGHPKEPPIGIFKGLETRGGEMR